MHVLHSILLHVYIILNNNKEISTLIHHYIIIIIHIYIITLIHYYMYTR